MKKAIALILAMVMLLSLCSCKGKKKQAQIDPAPPGSLVPAQPGDSDVEYAFDPPTEEAEEPNEQETAGIDSNVEGEIEENVAYLVEHYGFTTEELENIDVNRLVENYKLRTLDYTKQEVMDILMEYADTYTRNRKTEWYSIFSETSTAELDDETELCQIALYRNSGSSVEHYLVDLDLKKAIKDDDNEFALRPEQVDWLKEIPARWEIEKWDHYSENKNANSTASFAWKLVFKFKDDKYCVYSGYTEDYSSLPEGYSEMEKEILSIFR